MTDPYQNNPGGPQYGPPGTGPDLNKSGEQPQQPYAQSDPYAQQPQYGQPQQQYGQPPQQYGQPQYGQPGDPYANQGAYPAPPPQGYNPNDPEAPYGRDIYGAPFSDKQKLVAGLLQIFVGTFGVGRFYLGYTTIGVLQLVVSIVTCGIGAIWPLIDGIMILMGKVPDVQGRPLRD
ncbi:TM2 domain-containing protein [Nocardia asteroides]|uniref:TM2 domain-containing protein n=1 Tax=Nocardia asteroides TaxID=1824 RepID=UPI001E5B5E7D|nr:TM2 domain-containing protein [Nocardia asteroides]UGT60799.1 TM2 domain-containing protein [Nocardia asteroides]